MPARSKHPGIKLRCRVHRDGRSTWQAFGPLLGRYYNLTALYGMTTREECETWAIHQSKIRRARRSGLVSVDLGFALDDYEDSLRADRLRDGTVDAYRRSAREVVELLGRKTRTGDISKPLLHELRARMDRGTAQTRNVLMRRAARFLRWLHEQDLTPLLDRDSIHYAFRPVPVAHDAPRWLRPEEIAAMLQAAGDDPLPRLLLLTGMRVRELLGLKWEEVDLPSRCLRITSRTKTLRARAIRLQVCPSVEDWLHDQPQDHQLVLRGRGYHQARELLEKTKRKGDRAWKVDGPLREAVPGLKFKDLRSTSATYLHGAKGIPLSHQARAQHMGHSLAMAERRYVDQALCIPTHADTLEQAMGLGSSDRPDKQGGGRVIRLA